MNTIVAEKTQDNEVVTLDVFHRLADSGVIFITDFITDKTASDICATLILKDCEKHEKITLIINSEGGGIQNVLAIYDVILKLKTKVETICIGSASGESVILLMAGTQGMRSATKNSAICVGPLVVDMYNQSDMANARIFNDLIKSNNSKFMKIIASRTGKTQKEVESKFDRTVFMTAADAKKYGIIDFVKTGSSK